MAAKATAKAKAAKGTKANPKPPKKRAARVKKIASLSAQTQADILTTTKEAHPGITSGEFAELFRIAPEEVLRMRYFVFEYIKDFDLKNATLRMGYPNESAYDTGRIFLQHSFVQLRISEILREMDAENIVSASQLISKLWEEANKKDTVKDGCAMSNSATRIVALKELVKIKGLTAPKGNAPTHSPNGGVMLVPFYVAPDDWENNARESQKTLKDSVCIDAEVISNK